MVPSIQLNEDRRTRAGAFPDVMYIGPAEEKMSWSRSLVTAASTEEPKEHLQAPSSYRTEPKEMAIFGNACRPGRLKAVHGC